MKYILTFFLALISLTANAQYYENYIVDDVPYFIVKHNVNKSLRDKDAQILSANKVNNVLIKTDKGKITGKLLINNFGYIEDYYSYNEDTEAIELHWRYGYDINNNITSAYLRIARLRMNYIFSYEDNRLASIHLDSVGIESRYDFAYDNGKIAKVTLLDLAKDTVAAKYFFNYDSKGILENVTAEDLENVLYKVSYINNAVYIKNLGLYTESYKIENDRIISKTRDYHKELNPQSAVVRKNIVIDNFTYSSNGLIEKITTKFPAGNSYNQNFEYQFIN